MEDILGWASSAILMLTIFVQIRKQWRERSSEGISKWLFAGQIASCIGFTVYSYLVGAWVFVFTNALLIVTNTTGLLITLKFKREKARQSKQ